VAFFSFTNEVHPFWISVIPPFLFASPLLPWGFWLPLAKGVFTFWMLLQLPWCFGESPLLGVCNSLLSSSSPSPPIFSLSLYAPQASPPGWLRGRSPPLPSLLTEFFCLFPYFMMALPRGVPNLFFYTTPPPPPPGSPCLNETGFLAPPLLEPFFSSPSSPAPPYVEFFWHNPQIKVWFVHFSIRSLGSPRVVFESAPIVLASLTLDPIFLAFPSPRPTGVL